MKWTLSIVFVCIALILCIRARWRVLSEAEVEGTFGGTCYIPQMLDCVYNGPEPDPATCFAVECDDEDPSAQYCMYSNTQFYPGDPFPWCNGVWGDGYKGLEPPESVVCGHFVTCRRCEPNEIHGYLECMGDETEAYHLSCVPDANAEECYIEQPMAFSSKPSHMLIAGAFQLQSTRN